MLLSGMFAGYQSPLRLLMSGHSIPDDRIAPKRVEKFTRCEQIIPAPTYVRPKSKKNLFRGSSQAVNSKIQFNVFVGRVVHTRASYDCFQALRPNVGN